MISVTITGYIPFIDEAKYLAEARRINKEVVKKAAEVFFLTAAEEIPVWSGEAKASLLVGAKEVGAHITVSPKTYDEVSKTSIKSRVGIGISQGEFKWIENKNDIKFNFKSRVRHLSLLDNEAISNPPRKSAPWNAFKLGRLAAIEYLQKNARVPEIKDTMVNKRYFRRK